MIVHFLPFVKFYAPGNVDTGLVKDYSVVFFEAREMDYESSGIATIDLLLRRNTFIVL